MKTSNTLHVQKCSVDGCISDAIITNCTGDFATNPKGYCIDHVEYSKSAKQRQIEADNELLKELGFDVTFQAA